MERVNERVQKVKKLGRMMDLVNEGGDHRLS